MELSHSPLLAYAETSRSQLWCMWVFFVVEEGVDTKLLTEVFLGSLRDNISHLSFFVPVGFFSDEKCRFFLRVVLYAEFNVGHWNMQKLCCRKFCSGKKIRIWFSRTQIPTHWCPINLTKAKHEFKKKSKKL